MTIGKWKNTCHSYMGKINLQIGHLNEPTDIMEHLIESIKHECDETGIQSKFEEEDGRLQ